MDNTKYNTAVELFKAELIETATEMGLDVEYYKNEILTDERCMSLFSAEIAEKMLQIA